jgi:polar amino acid transport system substrate-binding protein
MGESVSWISLACLLLTAAPATPDTLDQIRSRGHLVWGGDQEGGAPFVFPRDDDPSQVRGCDVELMELLAKKLGVTSRFAQGQWDKLPELLERGDIDMVLSGYEWTEQRAARFGTSIPYYIYELQLLARKGDESLRTIEDLRAAPDRPRRRVAVLGGSAAQFYLEQHFARDVDVALFDGVTDAMRAVELSVDGIDANLQDLPIAVFYQDRFPGLRRVGDPVGMGYYVILVRKTDQRLVRALNDALVEALRDGSLREVMERYRIWNAVQARRGLETDAAGNFRGSGLAPGAEGESAAEEGGWAVVRRCTRELLIGAGITVALSCTAMPLAVMIGLIVALGRLYGPVWIGRALTLYVEAIRGTPLVLQLYVIFFLLPEIGVRIDAFWAAIIGLAINYSAYEAEIYRAGLQAIPRGQMEAALALGMGRGLALRRVIIPQATRIVIPPVTNDFIALFKDTAVCSVITVVELSKKYYMHAQSTNSVVELGIVTALLYMAMSYPLSIVAGYMERRLAREKRT